MNIVKCNHGKQPCYQRTHWFSFTRFCFGPFQGKAVLLDCSKNASQSTPCVRSGQGSEQRRQRGTSSSHSRELQQAMAHFSKLFGNRGETRPLLLTSQKQDVWSTATCVDSTIKKPLSSGPEAREWLPWAFPSRLSSAPTQGPTRLWRGVGDRCVCRSKDNFVGSVSPFTFM